MVSGGADGSVDYPTRDNQTTTTRTTRTGTWPSTTYPDGYSVYQTWHIHNGAMHCVADQNSTVTTLHVQAALVDGAVRGRNRQYVTCGSPAGDQEMVTTHRRPGPGDRQSHQRHARRDADLAGHELLRILGALGRQDQQLGDTAGDVQRVRYDYDTCGKADPDALALRFRANRQPCWRVRRLQRFRRSESSADDPQLRRRLLHGPCEVHVPWRPCGEERVSATGSVEDDAADVLVVRGEQLRRLRPPLAESRRPDPDGSPSGDGH